MMWPRRFWLKLHTLFRFNRTAQRLDDEIRFHLDQPIAEHLAPGMSPTKPATPLCALSATPPF